MSTKAGANTEVLHAIDTLSAKCKQMIGGAPNAYRDSAVKLQFWDARAGKDGKLYEDQIVRGSQHTQLQDPMFYGKDASVILVNGRATNNVMLFANFFSLPSRGAQDAVLAHEALHYFLPTLGDAGLAAKFGLDLNRYGTGIISDFLEVGCDKTKLGTQALH
jgi:hypothetical protein